MPIRESGGFWLHCCACSETAKGSTHYAPTVQEIRSNHLNQFTFNGFSCLQSVYNPLFSTPEPQPMHFNRSGIKQTLFNHYRPEFNQEPLHGHDAFALFGLILPSNGEAGSWPHFIVSIHQKVNDTREP